MPSRQLGVGEHIMLEAGKRFVIVDRKQDWGNGTVPCVVCGKKLQLFWKGGELDRKECCGHRYYTHHVRVDLIVVKRV